MSARLAWTPERVQTLSRLWLDGRSASEVARAIGGGVTRNAVIGKVHRLGLGGRDRPSMPRPSPATRTPVRRPRPRIVAPPTVPRLDRVNLPPAFRAEPSCGSATMLTATAHACRWPLGDPRSDSFALCGRAAARGAYCAEHAAVAFRPADQKPRRDSLLRLAGLR